MSIYGKYVYTMPTPSGERETRLLVRPYYTGRPHVTMIDSHGGCRLVEDVTFEEGSMKFSAAAGPNSADWTINWTEDGVVSGTARMGNGDDVVLRGCKTEITDEDDGIARSEMKKKALVMYASITGNTEKIAKAMAEQFEHYGWTVDLIKITNKNKNVPKNYNDYDVVCLGSLIIAGSPTTAIIKGFSLGGGGELEDRITANAAAGKGFNEGGAGMPGEGPGGAGGPMSGPGGPMPEGGMPGGPMPEGGMPGGPGGPGGGQGGGEGGLRWAGAPAEHGVYRPLGIVFTTYGGGFYGSGEAQGTLAQLKLYLELSNIRVVGTFACCGKEYGPAGLKEGELPSGVTEPPVYYKDADGLYHAGSFFFHTGMENKPAERDILKAKALVADLVEDYFYSHDGIRKDVWSTYTTIS